MKRCTLLLVFFLATWARADYLGSWKLNDYVTVTVTTHQFSTGAAYAATGDVLLDIYEDATTTELIDDTVLAQFDGRTALYQARVQLTAAAGFEKGKHYTCVIAATVDGVAALTTHTFQIEAAANATAVNGVSTANITAVNANLGTVQPVNQTGTGASAVVTTDAQATLANETYGLSALKTLIDAVKTVVDAVNAASTKPAWNGRR